MRQADIVGANISHPPTTLEFIPTIAPVLAPAFTEALATTA